MYFYNFFQTDVLLDFFIPFSRAEAIKWVNLVQPERDLINFVTCRTYKILVFVIILFVLMLRIILFFSIYNSCRDILTKIWPKLATYKDPDPTWKQLNFIFYYHFCKLLCSFFCALL